MKIFISADIEGVAGIMRWDEAQRTSPTYHPFREQMNREVAAACEGALAAGAEEILVKDAHGGANNLAGDKLPRPTQLIRGWSGHPFGMVQDLEARHTAALFVGYHARAGAGGNPLAHSFSSRKVAEIRLNGEPASEYLIHAHAAGLVGVPVVFVSGDATLCEEIKTQNPAVVTYATKSGEGPSQKSVHPEESVEAIRDATERALRGDLAAALLPPPEYSRLEIRYKEHAEAYRTSFYPGAKQVDPHTIALESESFFEILRALMFAV
jgi:D-amino peptidase